MAKQPAPQEEEHPSRERLSALGLGQLDEREFLVLAGHLARCPRCRAIVEGIPDDSFINLLRSAASNKKK
jgi:anti-sigma factor ChrR (cupin superfamily)